MARLLKVIHEDARESAVLQNPAILTIPSNSNLLDCGVSSRRPTISDQLKSLPLFLGCVVVTVTAPIWMPFLVIVLIWRKHRFQERMKHMGRFIEWKELVPRLESGRGTLIIEQAQKDGARVWWTDTDVLAVTAIAPPAEDALDYFRFKEPHPFVAWCHDTFLHPDTGSALLTVTPYRYPPGFLEASFFRTIFPNQLVLMTVKNPRLGHNPGLAKSPR